MRDIIIAAGALIGIVGGILMGVVLLIALKIALVIGFFALVAWGVLSLLRGMGVI